MGKFLAASVSILVPTASCVVLHERRVPHLVLVAIWAFGVVFLLGGSGAVAFASQWTPDELAEAVFHAYIDSWLSWIGFCVGLVVGIWAGACINENL